MSSSLAIAKCLFSVLNRRTVLAFLITSAAASAPALSQTVGNADIVSQMISASISGNLEDADKFLSDEITVHEGAELARYTREQWAGNLSDLRDQWGRSSIHQSEYIAQRDKVIAIYSIQTSSGPVSTVQAYKVSEGRIVEIWPFRFTTGLWTWDSELNGDTDAVANAAVFARWYEEVYPNGDWQLIPEVAGPVFLRHEDREFQMTGDEYSQRLRRWFEVRGPMNINYELLAQGDKVAVIGAGGFVQAWRVRDSKLVESWWVPNPQRRNN